jgi:hypothetical protein
MGRTITTLLGTKAADLDDSDLQAMRKVTGYVHRHLAQRPSGELAETPWRYSLMNWGPRSDEVTPADTHNNAASITSAAGTSVGVQILPAAAYTPPGEGKGRTFSSG